MKDKRLALKALLAFAAMVGLIWGRNLYLQKEHFKAAENFYKASNYKFALREYDTAMHFYTPNSSYMEKAALRLYQMGEAFEAKENLYQANIAYATIRSAFYASRSLYTPGRGWINRCDEKIAALNIKILGEEGTIRAEDAEPWKRRYTALLKEDRAPALLWAVLSVLGFAGWVSSAIYIIFKGFTGDALIRGRYMLYGVISFALTFALWVVSLLKA